MNASSCGPTPARPAPLPNLAGGSVLVSPSARFKIFDRDRFTCRYCGRSAPDVILELDHIHPRAEGGRDLEENYVTSCKDCNRGKGAKILSDPPVDKTFTGRWFHIVDEHGAAQFQGKVVADYGDCVEVQLFDWMLGTASWGTQVFPRPDRAWRLYRSDDEMREAYEYGPAGNAAKQLARRVAQ